MAFSPLLRGSASTGSRPERFAISFRSRAPTASCNCKGPGGRVRHYLKNARERTALAHDGRQDHPGSRRDQRALEARCIVTGVETTRRAIQAETVVNCARIGAFPARREVRCQRSLGVSTLSSPTGPGSSAHLVSSARIRFTTVLPGGKWGTDGGPLRADLRSWKVGGIP